VSAPQYSRGGGRFRSRAHRLRAGRCPGPRKASREYFLSVVSRCVTARRLDVSGPPCGAPSGAKRLSSELRFGLPRHRSSPSTWTSGSARRARPHRDASCRRRTTLRASVEHRASTGGPATLRISPSVLPGSCP
jgi:hypothetical protein